MDNVLLAVVALVFLSGGFFMAWIFIKPKNKDRQKLAQILTEVETLRVESKIRTAELDSKSHENQELKTALEQSRERVMELSVKNSQSETQIENLREKLEAGAKEGDALREKFVHEFKSLANEILRKESQIFTEQNKTNIEGLLKPLGEKIRIFEKKVDDVYEKEAHQRFSLKEEVVRLGELNRQVSTDARNLTEALKGQSKTQGNWGEMILENILEKSGLVKGREFHVQPSYKSEDGRRLQPDVVLSLPGDKHVVIDAKVSLNAYEQWATTQDGDLKKAALKLHLISVKKHIDELASKNYQHIYKLNSLDFVILFMPVEPAFLTAIQADPGLWNYAYTRGLLLVSPTNLYATLKMVASLWQQEYQNKNVKEIAEESGKLYDKFAGFVDDMLTIGDKLSAAKNSYDKAYNKLSTGRGNLISKAEKIKSLGAITKKEIASGGGLE